MSSAEITVENVTHYFPHAGSGSGDHIPAVVDVSFDVGDGEFVSLVGPSGCGKTTVLNMMAGFVRPTRGRVAIGGETVNGVRPHEITYMFARDFLLPWRRAIGNVELAMEFGKSRGRRDDAEKFLHTVGLEGFEYHYPSQLSQGMRQRVALARTLAAGGNVWLMDEPFAALDANTRTVLQAEFLSIWEITRKTVVFVTHDVVEAIALSDRVIVMTPGPGGHIKSVYDVDLPRPRNVIDLHGNARFVELYQGLWADLGHEAGAGLAVARA